MKKIFGKMHPLGVSSITKRYLSFYPVIYIQHINLFGGWVRVLMFGGRLQIDAYPKGHNYWDETGNMHQEHAVIVWQSGMYTPQRILHI